MPRTSAICRKADQGEGNTHITQDVVSAIRILPGRSCTMSFDIEAMSKAISTLFKMERLKHACFMHVSAHFMRPNPESSMHEISSDHIE